jgi:hypothetical protein
MRRRTIRITKAATVVLFAALAACGKHKKHARLGAPSASVTSGVISERDRETVYVLRSIREPRAASPGGCTAQRTGFEPSATDGERHFSFWSVETNTADGQVRNARAVRVATLRGCFGATADRVRQHFYAEIALGNIAFTGRGECVALAIDVPERGLIPVRCHLILSDLPSPYVGGLLTTNTLTSNAPFGGDTDPVGYAQASIATLRLWKTR